MINVFPQAEMKNSLKNIWDNGKKWFPLPGKWVSTSKNKVCFLKKWFPLISVTVSASRKKLSSKVAGSTKEKIFLQ